MSLTLSSPTFLTATDQSNVAEIQNLIVTWSQALERRDVNKMMLHYAPHAVLFDVKPPFQTQGVEAISAVWKACLPYFPKQFRSIHEGLTISISGDIAFVYGFHRIEPSKVEAEHPAGQALLRITVGFQRIDQSWKVIHEHVSLPFDPATGRVVFQPSV
jgi:ketosteroid isomerase-like protein